jgi:flagella basal body P-ring formation protein FlgA
MGLWRFVAGVILSLSCAAAVAGVSGSTRVRIDLPSQAQVKTFKVSLGEVAGISTPDLDVLRVLMALPLGRAPRAGESIRLRREEIARWIQRRTGLLPQQLSWGGDSSVQISTVANAISGDVVSSFAQNALQDWLVRRSESFHVEVIAVPKELFLPQGTISLKTRLIPETELRKRMSVWVDVYLDEVFARSVPVVFDVSAWAGMPVALHDALVGERISLADTVIKKVDITTLPAMPLATRGGIQEVLINQSSRLRRAIRGGEVLTHAHIEAMPAVAKGDMVKIRAVAGAVVLESEGAALQDGRIGQVIRVKSPNSLGVVSARVKSPGLLEVQ